MISVNCSCKTLVRYNLWLLVFAAVFLVAVHLPYLQDIHKQYAAFFLALLWFGTILGLDRLLRPTWIPAIIDKLAGTICTSRSVAVPILLFVTVVSFVWIIRITDCLLVSTRYQTHLATYSASNDVTDLTSAFALLPRRQDAMILFERHLLSLSTESDPGPLRRAAVRFVDHPDVVARFENQSVNTRSHCLCKASKSWLDPTLWYAMTLPMAETHGQTKRKRQARQYLVDRTDHLPSQLFVHILDLELLTLGAGPDHSDDLRRLIGKADDIDMSHLVQEALDHLAQYELTQNKCNIPRAIQYYRTLLDKRDAVARAYPNDRIWIRSPRKLSLFHKFRAIRNPTRPGDTMDEAHKMLNRCPGLGEAIKKDLYEVFSRYQNETTWYTNALLGHGSSWGTTDSWASACWRY
ncbi:MAG: hypothetical protein OXU75_17115 [Deltaproteobacteria bacterium]|nr:hypothetical protein [Deltaproteobacteria bacterium]